MMMRDIWSEEGKLAYWLRVELAAADTWPEMSEGDYLQIHERAFVDVPRMRELEEAMHHDLNAFVFMLHEQIGPPAASFIHRGLTSSDIVDTALSLQMVEGLHLIKPLLGAYDHPDWEDWVDASLDECSVGKLSGAVGTHATFPPEQEEEALSLLGLRPILSTQVVQRDIHASVIMRLLVIASALDPVASGLARSFAATALENVALWHERDISHSSNERVILPAIFIAAWDTLSFN